MTREQYLWKQDGLVANPLIEIHNGIIDQIFNDHEAQLKAKDEEIERLKAIIEEAIKKPMGVEPHFWSDYKMEKSK